MGTTKQFLALGKKLDQLHQDFLKQFGLLKTSTDPAVIAAAATSAANDVVKGVGSVATTKEIISTLKAQIAATKDPALRRVLVDALHRVERKLPGREWIAEQKAAANKIAKSNESVGQKVKDLRAIQERLIAHGDTAAARIVGALINSVVPAINNIRIVAGTALPGILPQGPGPRRNQNTPTPTRPRTGNSADRGQNRGGSLSIKVVTGYKATRRPRRRTPAWARRPPKPGRRERNLHLPQSDNPRGCRLVGGSRHRGRPPRADRRALDPGAARLCGRLVHPDRRSRQRRRPQWRRHRRPQAVRLAGGDCPLGRRLIWTGYVGPRTYRRGDGTRPSLITEAARWIDVNLQDINAFLSFRLLVDWGASGDA